MPRFHQPKPEFLLCGCEGAISSLAPQLQEAALLPSTSMPGKGTKALLEGEGDPSASPCPSSQDLHAGLLASLPALQPVGPPEQERARQCREGWERARRKKGVREAGGLQGGHF